jgi:hypothetical protein
MPSDQRFLDRPEPPLEVADIECQVLRRPAGEAGTGTQQRDVCISLLVVLADQLGMLGAGADYGLIGAIAQGAGLRRPAERGNRRSGVLRVEDSAGGRLLKNVRAAVAEYEREKISLRTTRGRYAKAERGLVVGSGPPPYG